MSLMAAAKPKAAVPPALITPPDAIDGVAAALTMAFTIDPEMPEGLAELLRRIDRTPAR